MGIVAGTTFAVTMDLNLDEDRPAGALFSLPLLFTPWVGLGVGGYLSESGKK